MRIISLITATQNLKKNGLLLFSAIAALCLFLSPSAVSVVCIAAVFVCVVVFAALDMVNPESSSRRIRISSILLAILITFIGYRSFIATWTPSSKVAALAHAIGTTTPILLLIVGVIGSIAGLYAMYILSCWIVSWSISLLEARCPFQQKGEIIANLKRNWYFPVSAMAFFCLSASLTLGYIIGLFFAFLISLILSSQIPSVWVFARKNSIVLRLVSIATAIGVCFCEQTAFYEKWNVSPRVEALKAMFPAAVDIIRIVSIFDALIAVFFVYFCVLAFWNRFIRIVSETKVFSDINAAEWIIYGVVIAVSLAFMIFSFAQTEAFYGTEISYDIIYTSDSPSLVTGNVYLALTHPENDLRQPLFAVFAAPFIGIPYLVARVFGVSASISAMLENSVQIVMLFAANFMVAKMMKLDSVKRICFMLLASFTYTQLLFTLMMEQYIVAYFWLILCMYLIAEKLKPDRIALWGAGGTLLASMILLPFMSDKSPVKEFKAWIKDMVKYGAEFMLLIVAFCRFDVIFNLTSKISQLSGFTGQTVKLADKLYQYTAFICNCFVAPNAGVNTTAYDHISWQLNTATGISLAGIVILALAIISAIWNRDKKSSLLAAGWIGYSAVMLLLLGWGTKENGLILYALYFGWAFFVLLFQLIEKLALKLKTRVLILIVTACAAVVLLAINIPAIAEMLNFATTYYPV